MPESFEPLIIGFTCNWCSYRAADSAGLDGVKYPPNIRSCALMCSGRIDPTFVLKAFANGADGVLVSGCHPGDCHYVEQNYKGTGTLFPDAPLAGLHGHRARARQTLVGQRGRRRYLCGLKSPNSPNRFRALGPLHWGRAAPLDAAPLAAQPNVQEVSARQPQNRNSQCTGPPPAVAVRSPY